MKNTFYLLFILLLLSSCEAENTSGPSIKQQNKHLNIAYEFYDNKQLDSALTYFGKAKNELILDGDSLRTASALLYMAIIANDFGLHFGAQELLVESSDYLNFNDTTQSAYINSYYTTLGNVFQNLGQYKQAIDYYTEGIKYSPSNQSTLILKNNIAVTHRYAGNFDQSIKIYEEFIEQSQSPIEHARTLSNLAYTKWIQNPNFSAEGDLLKALKIRQDNHDPMGLIASYKHLADYNMGKNKTLSRYYAMKMLEISENIGAVSDKSEALLKLAKLLTGENSNLYFTKYVTLADSLKLVNERHRSQFAVVKYESERYKNERNELEQDNLRKKSQILIQNILLVGTILLGVLILIIGWLWAKRKAIEVQNESREKIKQSQLQTSKRVHDVVANGLYRLMSDLENDDQLQRDVVLDRIEVMYEKSRDISYEESTHKDIKFKEKLRNICQSFSNEKIKVALVGNDEKIWKEIDPSVKFEFEHILQELLVNMRKHSKASHVLLKFEKHQETVFFTYTDNGIGFTQDTNFKNGLNNTVNRTNSIKGIINFDQEVKVGTKITIQFPVK